MKLYTIALSILTLIIKTGCASSGSMEVSDETLTGNQTINIKHEEFEIKQTYLTPESVERAKGKVMENRATEVYQWGLSLATFKMWYDAHSQVYGANYESDIVVYTSLIEKFGIVTSNGTTPYFVGWIDLKQTGPMQLELPAGKLAGGIYDFFQLATQDLGVFGPNKGKGGRFLIVPPGMSTKNLKTKGYTVIQPDTNKVMLGLRILIADPAALTQAMKSIKMAKYGKKLSPVKFIQNTNKRFRGHPPRGLDYYKVLHSAIQGEPIAREDRIFKSYMNDLGIYDGKPFNPSELQKAALTEGSKLGELVVRANNQRPFKDEAFYKGSQWYRSLANMPQARFDDKEYYLDQSNQYYYEAITISAAMMTSKPGFAAQAYLSAHLDSKGNHLKGSETYKLTVPANVPAENFWSLVIYSEDTRCLIDNEGNKNNMRTAMVNSRLKDLKKNKDGSIDIYVGKDAPSGMKSNWIQTPDGDGWFALFRFYGAKKEFFDKSWKLGEFVKQ